MNQTREEQICNELLHIWAKVYDFREELGENMNCTIAYTNYRLISILLKAILESS